MLQRSIDLAESLANGSMGAIVDIIRNKRRVLQTLHILFDGHGQYTKKSKDKANFKLAIDVFIERYQFPISLMYAITIYVINSEFKVYHE